MQIDHVLIAVTDLDEAAKLFEQRHGLASIEGGRHPGWGTANRIVPLGDSYLELIAVVDETEAAASAFGSWVLQAAAGEPRPVGWAVRTAIEAAARRLGLQVHDGSRRRPDGGTSTWRLAGVAEAGERPLLPFFIEWGAASALPGSAPAEHPAGAVALTRLELTGDRRVLDDWLGPHDLPIQVEDGPPAVAGIRLTSEAGPISL